MAAEPESPDDAPAPRGPLPVRAWSAPARAAAVILQALAALNIVYLGAHLLQDILTGTKSAPPQAVILGLILFSGVPWLASLGLGRRAAATIEIGTTHLVLATRSARFEIPIASISAVEPWAIPLPGAGIALRMTSGRRFRMGIAIDDPDPLLGALAEIIPAARGLRDRRVIALARARHRRGARRWFFWAGKYVAFPLTLTVVVFRLHQMIMYGGPFGEAHLHGWGAYLLSFAFFWAWNTAELTIYAAVIRLLAEAAAFALTLAIPTRAGGIRRAVEILTLLAYFGLIPAYVLVRLLA
ncbi:MAG: hypothetical protein QM820_62440 [Minicystis sp.]